MGEEGGVEGWLKRDFSLKCNNEGLGRLGSLAPTHETPCVSRAPLCSAPRSAPARLHGQSQLVTPCQNADGY